MRGYRRPASLNYLKSRLLLLTRPMVLGSAAVVILAIFFLAEYWKQPQRYLGGNTTQTPTVANSRSIVPVAPNVPYGVSPNLPELSGVADLYRLAETTNGSRGRSRSALPSLFSSPSSSLDSTIGSTGATTMGSTEGTGSIGRTRQRLSQGGFSLGDVSDPEVDANGLPLNRTGGANTTSSAADQPLGWSESPLQSALNRSAASRTTASDRSETASSSSDLSGDLGSSSSGLSSSGQIAPGQPIPDELLPPEQFIPQMSPPAGTTGYTVPPAFRTPTNSGTSSSSGFSSSGFSSPDSRPIRSQPVPSYSSPQLAPTVPDASSSYSLPSPQSYVVPSYAVPSYSINSSTVESQPVQPQPFSVPRSAPGRYIGGGEINTFSNP